jgi:diadenosine tetraphosphatase ApaH/serine/threonine PP2A family protein phosphatase
VIADIERRSPDLVVCGGDLALMGAQPAEVVDRIRELGWPTVVGNTDELLWRPEERGRQEARAPKLRPLLDLLFGEYAPATNDLLGDQRLAWLRELPPELEAGEILLMHAAPGDLWRAPMPDADDAELVATYGECDAARVVYGHIHRPYARDVDRLSIANTGSVGLPWDGDPRAAYLLVEDGRPRIMRVEYDVEREAQALLRSGYPDAERLAEMRRRGRFLPPGWTVSAERGTGS